MYVADSLVFVELHKTGCTHIGKWLSRLVPGEQVGKHNRVPHPLRDRYILGSVRNPWDWYVSLWAYGCASRGSVHAQTTRRVNVRYLADQLQSEMGRTHYPIGTMARQLRADLAKPVDRWRSVYRDANDATAFRAWLRLMFDPARRFDMGEGYGFSPVSRWAGILTYRYLKLFTGLDQSLYREPALGTLQGARELWRTQRLTRFVIRQENLEHDLLEALSQAGRVVSEQERESLLAARTAKTNTSQRRSVGYYYDAESVELVAEREALIIAEHGYRAPSLVQA